MPTAGIIGAGNIGSAVAGRLTAIGWRVLMANSRGPASLTDHASRLGVIPGTIEQAARAPDLVLLAIPEHAVAALPSGLFAGTPADTLVLDAGNYYPGVRDGFIAAIDDGLPDSVWVAGTIGRPVLKMFNTIHAGRIAEGHRPPGSPTRICLPVAGDDARAKARAIALADTIGFDAMDAGTLAQSWRQQPGTPVYCTHLGLAATREALERARIEEAAQSRREALDRARAWRESGHAVGQWPLSKS
jgi:8-hydroxy-5-deazaflavin:NADPH oxidoreductase